MGWWTVGPSGARRDLWVRVTGPGRPDRGRWVTPDGRDVLRTLATEGPPGLDVDLSWTQQPGSRGRQRTAMLWQTDLSAFKLVSQATVDVLSVFEPGLRLYPDLDVRLSNGDPVAGYVGVLEPTSTPTAVHSYFADRRADRFVVADEVAEELRAANLPGLRIDPADDPFPGDQVDDD